MTLLSAAVLASGSDDLAYQIGYVTARVLLPLLIVAGLVFVVLRLVRRGKAGPGAPGTPAGGFSPDGQWWWDGGSWQPAVSPDGRFRWDGTAWVPLQR